MENDNMEFFFGLRNIFIFYAIAIGVWWVVR